MSASTMLVKFSGIDILKSLCLIAVVFASVLVNAHANKKSIISISSGPIMAVDLNRDGKVNLSQNQPRVDEDGTIIAGVTAGDLTHPNLPYRFWVNNDLDVVNSDGDIRYDLTSCGSINDGTVDSNNVRRQICEQWDENPETNTNVSGIAGSNQNLIEIIESYRDLEDFSPLLIKIPTGKILEKYDIKLRAVGVSVNLFKGNWDDSAVNVAHAYIFDREATESQIALANKAGNHFPVILNDGAEAIFNNEIVSNFFDPQTGEGKFIFEALAPGAGYLELVISKKDDNDSVPTYARVHMDLHDIKDYYQHVSAGTAQHSSNSYQLGDEYKGVVTDEADAFNAKYYGGYTEANPRKLDIYTNLIDETEITRDLVVFVHGWRMKDNEKISFSETAYKRLYWSGYKSQFSAFTWPTGWFDKPAHYYNTLLVLFTVLGNERNYDTSEVVARNVGKDFHNYLLNQQSNAPAQNRHIIAHSMGNLVASEALNYSTSGTLVSSYTASQAASAAGSYDSNAPDVTHELKGVPLCSAENVEEVWRCYNKDNELVVDDTPFDMPPDMYRNNFVDKTDANNWVIRHGQTTAAAMGRNADGNHYFKGISSKVGRIVNIFNPQDQALTAWEFNQLTKPDAWDGRDWFYTNSYRKNYSDYEICVLLSSGDDPNECSDVYPELPNEVISEFQFDSTVVSFNADNVFRIMGYAVPARTQPLGQQQGVQGEITTNPFMDGFTNSNQDHSAPFHGYYAEPSSEGNINPLQQRAAYWNTVLVDSLFLTNESQYTGLKNAIPEVSKQDNGY